MKDFSQLEKLHLIFSLPSVYSAHIFWDILLALAAQFSHLDKLQSLTITVLDVEYTDRDLETRMDTCCEFLVPPLSDMAVQLGTLASLKTFTIVFDGHAGEHVGLSEKHRQRVRDALELSGKTEILQF